jgi:uncharacterized protein involved in exopolysaccharide biosynthesis
MSKSIKSIISNAEISLSDLISVFWDRRMIILYSIAVVFILGMIRFLTSPPEFDSSSIKLSESSSDPGNIRQFGSLAGLAGINLPSAGNSGMNYFSPDLYPKLLESNSFLLELSREKFYFQSKKDSLSIYEYFVEERPGDILTKSFKFIVSLPSTLFSSSYQIDTQNLSSPEPKDQEFKLLQLSPEEIYVIGELKKRLKIEESERMLTLSVKMPEAIVAAQLNSLVFDKILNYVVSYKIEKQRFNLNFIQKSVDEAEKNFKQAQLNLASFRDSNQGIISERVRTREELLESEYNLSFQLYSTVKQEYENAKLELNREIPVFTTFEKSIVPLSPSNSSPLKTILFSIVGGFFLGIFIITFSMVKILLTELKSDIK